MIPRIIHQTWKTHEVPERFQAWSKTWRHLNPGWEYRLWSDRDLLEFVAAEYPGFLELFCSYSQGVQRADAARYMLLHHFGGLYADIDTECRQSLASLEAETRVVLAEEPRTHWKPSSEPRGLPYFLFNGVMASPTGHPFWPFLLERMRDARHARDVLDSTGPCLLTACQIAYPRSADIRVEGPMLFNPVDVHGAWSDGDRSTCLAVHHWAGTWWNPGKRSWLGTKKNSVLKRIYRARAALTEGKKRVDPAQVRAAICTEALSRDLPTGNNIAILVPVRDASQHIERFIRSVEALDWPKDRIKLVFCEGDSEDDSFARLSSAAVRLKADFRDVIVFQSPSGLKIDRSRRSHRKVQRVRRAALAKARNALIDRGVDDTDDWALWIDVDVWRFPEDIVSTLLEAKARIVVPDCVTIPDGPSFDQNSFLTMPVIRDYRYYRMIYDGLFQPPSHYWHRRHLSDLRHSDRVPLDSVGGTMLLVDAALHRGGLRFPEQPYDDLIETEAFGRLARDVGVTPIGLPRVQIMHVPW
jgi:hypothetical protein